MLHKKLMAVKRDIKTKQEEMAKHPVIRVLRPILWTAMILFALFLNSSDILEGIRTFQAAPTEKSVTATIAETMELKYKEKLRDSTEVIRYFMSKEKEAEDVVRQSMQ